MRLTPWGLALLLPLLLLAGCGGDDEPAAPASFAPLHYEYLTKLRLNVATINVVNQTMSPDSGSAISDDPVDPVEALTRMAHDRLVAAGVSGTANFVIDHASIQRAPDGTLTGTLAVHLDIQTDGGARSGFAEAHVSRQMIPGSDTQDEKASLYDLTKQMMDAMNVELEYQLRKSLGDWLVSDVSIPAPVTAAPLPPASPAPPTGGMAQSPLPPASPLAPDGSAVGPAPETVPGTPVAPAPETPYAPQQMSPPPGFLQLPQGTTYQ